VVEESEAILAIERSAADETMSCVFNMSPEPVEWRPAKSDRWCVAEVVGQVADWRFGGSVAMIARRT